MRRNESRRGNNIVNNCESNANCTHSMLSSYWLLLFDL